MSRSTQRSAQAVAAALTHLGPTEVVMSPGSRNTPLALAFDQSDSATVRVVLDERAAGFVALGIAKASGRPAILLCTSGSAGAHYLPAVIEASEAQIPMVVVTADRPPELHHVGAAQTCPQSQLMAPYCRAAIELPVGNEPVAPSQLMALATVGMARAIGTDPGPVHFNAPYRQPLWTDDADDAGALPVPPIIHQGTEKIDGGDLEALVEQLGSERVVVVLGPRGTADGRRDRFRRRVRKLAAATGWPVIADAASGARFGGAETTIHAADSLLRSPAFVAAHRADTAIVVGGLPCSKPVQRYLVHGCDRIVAVAPGGKFAVPEGNLAHVLVSVPSHIVRALADTAVTEESREFGRRWLAADAVARDVIESHASVHFEGALAGRLAAALRENTPLFVGSSMPIRDVDGFGRSPLALDVFANRGVNGIDGAIASAAGVAIARGEPTVALVGDLTFLHDIDGLMAAAELGAPITIVVANNSGGGIFEFLPIARHPSAFERLFATPQSASIEKLCGAVGAHYLRFDHNTSIHDVGTVVRNADPDHPLRVVEVVFDRKDNVAAHEAVWREVDTRITASLEKSS